MKEMKNKFILGYSIISSIFILFSVSFFAFNLYKEYSKGYARTNSSFIRTANHIKAASYQTEKDSPNYTAKLFQAIENYEDIYYIEVKRDGEIVLTYPDISRSFSSSKLTKEYSETVQIHDSTLEVNASLYLLRPFSIHYYAKLSFLMILIITMITVILIIYIQMKETGDFQDEEEESEEINEVEEQSIEDFSENDKSDDNEFCENNNIDNSEAYASEDIKDKASVSEVEIEDNNLDENKEAAEIIKTSEPEKEIINEDLNEKKAEEEEPKKEALEEKKEALEKSSKYNNPDLEPIEPNGLYSPVTGIGWESYIMPRLENEVNRAIASEMDLALFVIQIPEINRESQILQNICNYLAIQFQFRDLLFEYKEDCIVAMKINMNLDEALNFADKLYADINNLTASEDKKCFIGISTRSIRIVPAKRLFIEAEQAHKKKKSDKESSIIAFRADSEKYRQYLDERR